MPDVVLSSAPPPRGPPPLGLLWDALCCKRLLWHRLALAEQIQDTADDVCRGAPAKSLRFLALHAQRLTHTLRCTARYLIFCRSSRPVLPRRQVPSPDVAPRQGLHSERAAPLVSTTRRIWGARVRACRSHRPQCLSRLSSRRRCNREACTWVSISWRLFPDQPRGGGVEEDEAAAVHLAQLCIWTC